MTDSGAPPPSGRPTRRRFAGMAAAAGLAFAMPGTAATAADRSPAEAWIDVRRMGAAGDGKADDSAAIEAGLAAIGERGGTLFFPRGTYRCSSQVRLDGRRSVRLLGEGGLTDGGAAASVLSYAGGGEGSFISARSSAGVHICDLQIAAARSDFSGRVLDFDQAPGDMDTSYGVVERCHISSVAQEGVLISLARAIVMTVRNCGLAGGAVGIRGRNSKDDYSNAICIDNCAFLGMRTVAAEEAGEAWTFTACAFEPLADGSAGAYRSTLSTAAALRFGGCWFGDASQEGTWITFSGSGLNVEGCLLGTGAVGIRLQGSSNRGIVVTGNQFSAVATALDLGIGNEAVLVAGNDFQPSVVAPVVALNALPGSLHQTATGGISLTAGSRLEPGGGIPAGDGPPEGRVPAMPGALYVDRQGGLGTTLYVKEAGTDSMGWVAK